MFVVACNVGAKANTVVNKLYRPIPPTPVTFPKVFRGLWGGRGKNANWKARWKNMATWRRERERDVKGVKVLKCAN